MTSVDSTMSVNLGSSIAMTLNVFGVVVRLPVGWLNWTTFGLPTATFALTSALIMSSGFEDSRLVANELLLPPPSPPPPLLVLVAVALGLGVGTDGLPPVNS